MNLSLDRLSYEVSGASLLTDVTFEVAGGSRTAIIGPNGAGKSTLLRLVAGDMEPTSGSVAMGGNPLARVSIASRAKLRSVLAHQHSTDVTFTVEQVVAMGRYPYRLDSSNDPHTDQVAVQSAIELLDLSCLRSRQVRSLSGGEQQRVAFARVLAQQAPIVLLDEPTTALDIKHQESVMAIIEDLGSNGHGVLAVLHDLNMSSHFDQVVLLHEGRIAAMGSPSEVLTTEGLTNVYGHPIDVVEHPTRPGVLMAPQVLTRRD